MKCATVSSKLLAVTGRWDVSYTFAVLQYMEDHGLSESRPEDIRTAMAALKAQSIDLQTKAKALRTQAAALMVEARKLDETAKVAR